MFFLNFGLLPFLAAAGAASLLTLGLYLLDRSRRQQVVATLRFWTAARQPVQTSRRRHIQQPWSLVLQLLGILLLLLAMAQPRWGNPFTRTRNHVLVLDTSAWMGALRGSTTLMDEARRRAAEWLAAVPANDRVMLVRADALATPATAFEADHQRVAAAIAASEPSATALDIGQALAAARRAQSFRGDSGEIAFVGSDRVDDARHQPSGPGTGIRVLLVKGGLPNAGIREVTAHRVPGKGGEWTAVVRVRNYGAAPRTVTLGAAFDKAAIGTRQLALAPGAEGTGTFVWSAATNGLLEVQLGPGDAFPDDDAASVEVGSAGTLPVVVYTDRPAVLRPLLASNARLDPQFRTPAQYRDDDGTLVVLDRFAPPRAPRGDALWIDPPAAGSPATVLRRVGKPGTVAWITGNALGEGLHQHETRLAAASIFEARPGDIRVAEVAGGPIVLARPGTHKTVLLGFDPELAATRYELSTPLAFANALRWLRPDAFVDASARIQPAGYVSSPLPGGETANGPWQVTRADGRALPFTVDHGTIHFFSGTRDTIQVRSPERQTTYALTLPDVGTAHWAPPADAEHGRPGHRSGLPLPRELWPWLAGAGAALLAAEWLLFARSRRTRAATAPVRVQPLRRAS